jgi:hypothetical protein
MTGHAYSLAALLLVTACTGVPIADDLQLSEGEIEAMLVEGSIPDARRVEVTRPRPETDEVLEVDAGPVGPPRIVVSAFDPEKHEHGTALCPFEVEGRGFPAVSVDGETVAVFVAETLSSSDGEDEVVSVDWIDVERDAVDETLVVVNGWDFPERYEEAGEADCRQLWRRAKVRAARANAKLASTHWRPLQSMPVDVVGPYGDDDLYEPDDEDAPRLRRVQLVYQHGQAILRIRGVKVLERRTTAWDHGADDPDDPDDVCDFFAYPQALFADTETGVAMAEVGQEAGPCFCYSSTTYRRVDLSPTTHAEIMRRGST